MSLVVQRLGAEPSVMPAAEAALLGERVNFGSLSLGERVRQWAIETPSAVALESTDVTLSYAQLDRRVNQLGRWLQARGAGPDTLVALSLQRSIELVVAMLASWRVGAAFVPLDPTWPDARRDAVLAEARPVLVVTATDVTHLSWDSLADEPLRREISLREAAYVLYTSGSTGRPKGVVVEHAALLNYVAAASRALDLRQCRRWGLVGSLATDLAYTALFGGLFNGASVVVARAAEVGDADSFARFVSEHNIDALKIVPSHLDALLECAGPVLPRRLILGGEATSASLVERIRRHAPDCRISNHYGPTETAVGVMIHTVEPSEPAAALPLTTALPNCDVWLLDANLGPVTGEGIGEIYVGGPQVCRGYLGSDESAVFVSHPLLPGERLYRTGDLAYRLPQGGLRLAGRVDSQVKIQGFRVEPAEVEAALLECPGVRQAVVIAKQTDGVLIAFLVGPEAGAVSELRRELGKRLPAYMVPADCIRLDTLPRLANGKIDRKQLAQWPTQLSSPDGPATARDSLEGLIAEHMARLLGRECLGVSDDFFELGGHSLLVIRLVARLGRLLGVDIAPGLVFDWPTPSALAAALRTSGGVTE